MLVTLDNIFATSFALIPLSSISSITSITLLLREVSSFLLPSFQTLFNVVKSTNMKFFWCFYAHHCERKERDSNPRTITVVAFQERCNQPNSAIFPIKKAEPILALPFSSLFSFLHIDLHNTDEVSYSDTLSCNLTKKCVQCVLSRTYIPFIFFLF